MYFIQFNIFAIGLLPLFPILCITRSLPRLTDGKARLMEALKANVWQLLDEVPGQAKELILAGLQGHVPAKTVLLSIAFVSLFKIVTGIYCALVSIASMQNMSLIRVP